VTAPVMLGLPEHSVLWTDQLDAADAGALAATGAVRVSPVGAGWQVSTSSIVGVIRVGEVELRIEPKIAMGRLLFLLLFAADPEGWRAEDADLATASDLAELLARAFTSRAEGAVLRGLLRGYVRRDEALPVLRGRVRAGDQLAARSGLAVPLEVTFDEYTVDILENQILSAATLRLRKTTELSAGVHGELRRLQRTLEDVSPWPRAETPPAIDFHRLNAHYAPAIELARLVLAATTLDTDTGSAVGTGVLFDMNRVFESFLTAALTRAVPPVFRVTGQYVTSLDLAGNMDIRPDVTWWDGRVCVAVADAKYKDLRVKDPPSGDLYQLLAYCTVLGLDEGHLVYGAGSGPPRSFEIRRAGTTLHVHHLDLSVDPDALLVQVAALSGAVLGRR
jgi:5-methylcytosine-specific restriction enzyme subunit McrC